ncbi:ABC transporter ATP-binding protein [Lactiplantibacillus plantarum]|uniref:ATP-binding cassette domain-containing protein n=1 Tax=Lactiplantibacillus plantarum TaxID=1590 RepID=UPI0007BBD429|nr:ABC transporter ATP-binding protein [Lactiplantibacillus plantarum]AYE59641.1 ABC transporter ATP-binding protein [Lactiplantibacillus plantarum]KZU57179.1 ABC transporter ATP-binding protein [Lactiplantibacillus plantarum]QBJ54707.1 ABC transporter ATP-binding protein [Lactiplantibacillus plantarum]
MKIENITVQYGKKSALQSVNLDLTEHGKIIGFLGPNGAGKTTLINLLVGHINSYSGKIDLSNNTIAFCPDKPFLYESMTVKEAINLYGSVYPDFDTEKAEKIFSKLSIDLNMKIHDGSKGIHEQIHIVLTLSRNTSLYIFDEPLAAVDPLTRDYLIKIILNNRPKDSNILMSTHLIKDIDYIFDSVIFINDGKILLHDSIQQLKEKYNKPLEDIFKEVIKHAASHIYNV